ncbi:MAG: lysophospholipid acyltransferase family protein [Planktotalea sp.]|jgi:1-acyl-sn-glycerol-3-phosphate acyltransferase|uniref:lysophospholipid acyltransferase family protein n=1 Tax=Planktotalea sp. TaxID=2029877 RepID=UPI000183A6C3|nr:lysophospholipid acyltransferase family protein [Planktotalea sp.]EDZ42370.1 phospholipid/glycerol acyltransferase [Rhodobacteraceae bacterium HTCC2083]MBT5822978.1 1-acyl-sn-glycerol-3-phosphate acyltransferase [Paracoccaceae bacterium]MDG1075363.1 lysophospholipid acyltransferase family protein [Planktotalea sp.]MDG1085048.1 lysophospholipid acyltransferase family protein [Planktotalea sp.]HCW84362.1 1-acyl-sn-glycerol-3-phosphate acyltransferase [Paracoccaceae bacterium]
MNEKKNPLQWLRSLLFVGQIYFMMPVIGLLFAPWALFSRRGARTCCKTYSRWVFWTASWMVGLKVEVRGIPPKEPGLVAAKHQSFLDIMMIFTATTAGKFIMKKQILWTPVIGQYAKLLNCIAVDRGKRGAAIEKMVADVKAGLVEAGQLIIYSQGTRVAPGVQKPYKVGTGVLYEQMGQTCYPVATNVGVFWPRTGIYRKPGVAVVEFLEPIAAGLTREEFMALLEERVETRSNALMREAGFEV